MRVTNTKATRVVLIRAIKAVPPMGIKVALPKVIKYLRTREARSSNTMDRVNMKGRISIKDRINTLGAHQRRLTIHIRLLKGHSEESLC